MEIELIIREMTDERQGISEKTNNPYHIASFLGETEEYYPQRIVFDVSVGANSQIKPEDIEVGKRYKVSLNFNGYRGTNGKWYNNIKAWKAEAIN